MRDNKQNRRKMKRNYPIFLKIYFKKNKSTHTKIPPKKLEEVITSRKVKEAVDKLKNNKSPGCDEINAELKNSPTIIFESFVGLKKERTKVSLKNCLSNQICCQI